MTFSWSCAIKWIRDNVSESLAKQNRAAIQQNRSIIFSTVNGSVLNEFHHMLTFHDKHYNFDHVVSTDPDSQITFPSGESCR